MAEATAAMSVTCCINARCLLMCCCCCCCSLTVAGWSYMRRVYSNVTINRVKYHISYSAYSALWLCSRSSGPCSQNRLTLTHKCANLFVMLNKGKRMIVAPQSRPQRTATHVKEVSARHYIVLSTYMCELCFSFKDICILTLKCDKNVTKVTPYDKRMLK